MKNIKYFIAVIAIVFASGCDDSFLDKEVIYQKSLDTFYQTPQDIEEAVAGVYNALYVGGVHSEEHVAANLLSDLMLGGGGPDDISAKNVDSFQDPNEDTYKDLWVKTYEGLFRANAIIEAVPEADYSEFFDTEAEAVAFKNQALGEVYFMRAFLLFRAAKFFGGMPLIMATATPRDLPRATIGETYGQIASDLLLAIATLPDESSVAQSLSDYGHANRWAAQAYLGRIYLFYTGYMTNIAGEAATEITLPDGGTVTKADVIAELNDCIANSGYGLLSDFRNLWPYSFANENSAANGFGDVLPWATTEGLAWAGQDGHHSVNGTGNTEVMFAKRYAYGNWDWPLQQAYNNRTPLFFGVRGNTMVPFGQGWGWGTIHPSFYSLWNDADPRKQGSVVVMGDVEQGTDGYANNQGDHETGLFNKKYITLTHDGADGVQGLFYYLYNMVNGDPLQLWAAQDFFYMRFSDVLLMQSELTEDATNLNVVRARAGGLAPVAYSLDAIKAERMHEFAFEGIRWFDLVRWGDVEDASKNFYDNAVDVNNSGVTVSYSVQYRTETKGLVPVPESEIRLANGVYEQNAGW